MVLHYESVAYERWTTKFSELAARHGHDDAILEKLPFPFYRSSLSAVGRLAAAPERDKARAAEEAFRVWAKRKLVAENKLAPSDTITVTAVKEALEGLGLAGDASAPAPPAKRLLEGAPPPPAGGLPRLG